jgi:hypothetical protein
MGARQTDTVTGIALAGRTGGTDLILSANRKTASTSWWDPRYRRWVPRRRNSFGLPPETTCPGRTRFCDGCYAVTTVEVSKGTAAALEHNLALLRATDHDGMVDLLDDMLDRYRQDAANGWTKPAERIFRWHWSGDFFSAEYADAVAIAARRHPDVGQWVYTRSFVPALNVVPIIDGIPQLRVYLSIDRWNLEHARPVLAAHPDVRAAWCADVSESARELARAVDRAVPMRICPENVGRLPLVVRDTARSGHGACQDCRICPEGRADVGFVVDKR